MGSPIPVCFVPYFHGPLVHVGGRVSLLWAVLAVINTVCLLSRETSPARELGLTRL